jgi:hypothetical protein
MSEFEQDPSANTARFRAFVERGDDDVRPPRRFRVSPGPLIAVGVVIVAIIVVVVAVA